MSRLSTKQRRSRRRRRIGYEPHIVVDHIEPWFTVDRCDRMWREFFYGPAAEAICKAFNGSQ